MTTFYMKIEPRTEGSKGNYLKNNDETVRKCFDWVGKEH